jgi:hypothetical protein
MTSNVTIHLLRQAEWRLKPLMIYRGGFNAYRASKHFLSASCMGIQLFGAD